MQDYYDEEFAPRSPLLQPVHVKATPSPSPPPIITKNYPPTVSSPSSSRRQRKANRRKTRPTQGDWVLIREMAPNQPDIAQQVSQQALNSDSSESGHEDDDEMEDQSSTTVSGPNTAIHPARPTTRTNNVQHPGKDVFSTPGQPTATSTHRDSVLEADIKANAFAVERRASEASYGGSLQNGVRRNTGDTKTLSGVAFTVHSASPASLPSQRRDSTATSHADDLSTNLHQLQIPETENRLPIIQPQTPLNDAPSPSTHQSLPPIAHMVGDLPRSASISEESRANGPVHRQSISSMTHSPTARVRQMSISSHTHTPVSPYPLTASSPISANSDMQRGDIFLRSGSGQVFGADHRRPSQASESGRYPPTLHSASTSEGYQSSDGPSPASHNTPVESRQRLMSLDGTMASSAIILPPPNGSGIQQLGQHAMGNFRCEYPGCNALPFQTQYLLNSHTNVHSSNRPHYCPVPGCPRSEGGKGFKRKNEMIRHGLVHQSPGYVCPFCPDREHKYPRPDNLQRHVRVHHVDKDKDDLELRNVLAQRPEGGSRGRRRRVSGVD